MASKTKRNNKIKLGGDVIALNILTYSFTIIMALLCLFPFVMVIAGSLSSEEAVVENGFSILIQDFSVESYKTIFLDPNVVVRAFLNTTGLTIIGTVAGLLVQTMTAYALSRKDFTWKSQFTFFFYFTTLFSGGLVPYYILMTDTLDLGNTYWALFLPLLFNVMHVFILRANMQSIPDALIDAAKIDGASEIRILFQIIWPLITPALATIALFIGIGYWNDWYNAMLFVSDKELYPLQYFLYEQVNNIEGYKRLIANNASAGAISAVNLPAQTLKMALTVVVTGPIILVFPFIQKYFVQGLTIGSVKG